MRQALLKWRAECFDASPYLFNAVKPDYVTSIGGLFASDCMTVLPNIRDSVIDTIFADPPFNLGKQYGKNTNDRLEDDQYLEWCRSWLRECVRTLKPGGAFFVYNLPKWNVLLGAYLMGLGLDFRHWISIEISACLPIPGRLRPS